MKEVSEFLTGRLALCELSPLALCELPPKNDEDLWLKGGYPDGGILGRNRFPSWQQNYLDLLAMRDLPSWGLTARPRVTRRFFKMLAAVHGNTWNASQIGKSLGVSYHTVNAFLEYLEQAFLIRRLVPFYRNIKKRLIKSPKIYWRDSGLLHSLLNVSSKKDLLIQPWVGQSWEGWVIEQILIFLNTRDNPLDDPCFLRTSDGQEVDLILKVAGLTYAVEIKLTSSPAPEDFKRLIKTADLIGAEKKVLISRTIRTVDSGELISTNLRGFLKYLEDKV
jgi:predicted AAA+ superfamily ATPase